MSFKIICCVSKSILLQSSKSNYEVMFIILGWIITGVVFIALSVPLILRKIPPNSWYGFRTHQTLSNDNIWYSVNHMAGMDFMIVGFIIIIVACLTYVFSNKFSTLIVEVINLSMMSVSILAATIHCYLYSKSIT